MAGRTAHRYLLIVLMGALVAALVPVTSSAKRLEWFSLRPGEAALWSGRTSDPGASCGTTSCSSYQLIVESAASRLRVAIDDGDLELRSAYRVELLDPSGKVATRGPIEVFVTDPEPGSWLVNVISTAPDDGSFRLRAKLETDKDRFGRKGLLRPNLRPEPGYDFTFSWAEGMCGAYTGSSACEPNSPVPLAPSCAVDETAEDHAVRCLRFSMGYQNAGDGPVNLHFGDLDLVSGTVDVTQWIYKADKSEAYEDNDHVEVPAGTASYHKTHGHYHYDNIFGARLFSVDPRSRLVEPLGDVAKRGACAHDYVFVEFERFYQDRQNLADSGDDCNFLFTKPNVPARIGLSTGWADIYTAELSDNYVDFGINLDGYYLLRFYSDVDDTITETNERDNVAYSYIKVSGFDVELIERGRGRDPWDPNKVVLRGLGD